MQLKMGFSGLLSLLKVYLCIKVQSVSSSSSLLPPCIAELLMFKCQVQRVVFINRKHFDLLICNGSLLQFYCYGLAGGCEARTQWLSVVDELFC